MIQKMASTTIYVLDQNSAKDFYVNKLGFQVHDDVTMDNGFRWLTVTPPGQPGFDIILMATNGPGFGAEGEEESNARKAAMDSIRHLVKAGKLGAGVFSTPNLDKTFQDLSSKGVAFTKEPTKEFYAYEAVFVDDSGNWFSLTESS